MWILTVGICLAAACSSSTSSPAKPWQFVTVKCKDSDPYLYSCSGSDPATANIILIDYRSRGDAGRILVVAPADRGSLGSGNSLEIASIQDGSSTQILVRKVQNEDPSVVEATYNLTLQHDKFWITKEDGSWTEVVGDFVKQAQEIFTLGNALVSYSKQYPNAEQPIDPGIAIQLDTLLRDKLPQFPKEWAFQF